MKLPVTWWKHENRGTECAERVIAGEIFRLRSTITQQYRLHPLADLFPTYTPLDSLYADYKVTRKLKQKKYNEKPNKIIVFLLWHWSWHMT